MRQVRPSSFGRKEGGSLTALDWECLEQVSLHGTGKVDANKEEWYLGLSSELATTVEKALEVSYSQ